MNSKAKTISIRACLTAAALILPTLLPLSGRAATVWTGPNMNFSQSTNAADQLTPNVALSRGANGPLFNSAAGETGPDYVNSPSNTEWAFGSLANYATLTYQPLAAIRNNSVPNFSAAILNQPMVLHLINEDIYLAVTFTSWGRFFSGGFAYTRSTPAPVAPPPSVSISNPANGATFVAPANVQIDANATVPSGAVTNVSFFANGNFLGADLLAPFSINSGSLSAGAYALTAVATAAGISATSTPVNISVLLPGTTTLSGSKVAAGLFTFDYTTTPGLKYAVEKSSDLVTWQPLVTNTAAGNLEHYTNTFVPNAAWYYRVGQVTGP